MAPGLCQMVGGRPKPSPCLKLFSFLYPKSILPAKIQLNDQTAEFCYEDQPDQTDQTDQDPEIEEIIKDLKRGTYSYTLEDLAYARSGDKGNSCNIGVIARHPKYLPYIKDTLTSR
jgi:hypothetical protein